MKTLFLTGGSRGIGKAIANKFLEMGYRVLAPSRKELNLNSVDSIASYFANNAINCDVFIYSAGVNCPKGFSDIMQDDFLKTMQINTGGFYQIMQFLLPSLKLNKGYVLGISSIYSFISRTKRLSYAASKHALNGMIKTLALELGHNDILINALAPGFVDTELTRNNNSPEKINELTQKIPLGKLASPEDIANIAFFLCSQENKFITGQCIVADGGYCVGGFEN